MGEVEETTDKTPLFKKGGNDNDDGFEMTLIKNYDRERNPDRETETSTNVETQETSFSVDGVFNQKMESKEEADKRVKHIFPNADTSKSFLKLDEYGQVIVQIDRKKSEWNSFFVNEKNGELSTYVKKTINRNLGKSKLEFGIEQQKIINDKTEEIAFLEKKIPAKT